jgi:hypothetical protein
VTTGAITGVPGLTRLADAAVLLPLGIIAHLIVWAICVLSPAGHLGDFQRYWDIATAAGRPYVDVPVEYPPGALLVFRVLTAVTGSEAAFFVALLVLNLAADALVLALLVAVWGTTAGAVYLVISVPILSLLFFRFDLWPVAAATAAVGCWTRGRWRDGVGMLGIGVALKLWPLPLAALLLAGRQRSSRAVLSSLGGLAVVGLATAVAWFWYSGVDGLLGVLTFRGATGWGIEGTIGSVARILDPGSIRLEAGAVRAGRTVPLVSIALFVISLPLACWALYRGAVTGRIGTGWVTGVGAVLACSALLSPQFLGWLLPAAAIAWVEGDRRTTRWLATLVVVTVLYRILHTTQMPGLVLVRNLLLIAMVGDGVWRLLGASTSEPREDGPIGRFESDGPPRA